MCGIAGIVGAKKIDLSGAIKNMTDVINHRGPDGDGHWLNAENTVALGHRRLAIIDLSDDGKQPMSYADGRYYITFNGEIYNYVELKEELLKKGYKFKSESDTEVLLAAFDDKKERCLDDLDGMFSFAIWDEKEQRLFCARDRFGEKPFLYATHDGNLYFASEMKALWAAGVPRINNQRLLFNYLLNGINFNPTDTSETFFENVYKLKASHYFYVSPNDANPTQLRYWDIAYTDINYKISPEEAEARFRELFNQSVKRRLRSDVPVGSSLSGGLDSSLIVCTIDNLNADQKIKQATFSARFRNFSKDEGKYMQMVIDRTNVEPHFVYPDEDSLLRDFERLCYHQEEPFGSASIYAQYCVMRLAKENNVTVLLDGQGADELLSGYHRYFYYYFKQLQKTSADLYKQERKAFYDVRGEKDVFSFKQKGMEFLIDTVPQTLKTSARKYKKKLSAQFKPFLNKNFFYQFADDDYYLNFNYASSLPEALYQSSLRGELEDLLRYADRNSMAHSREVRLPFLSHELAEFLFTLPENFKIRGGITKYIMRKTFAEVLPEGILNRQDKIGYEPPQSKWLDSPQITEKIRDTHSDLVKSKILDNNSFNQLEDSSLAWRVLMAKIVV